MKKLMIAAMAASMVGGAYAAFCDDDPIVVIPDECRVYDVKLKVKTLAPKAVIVKTAYECDDPTVECVSYYKNATRTFDGLLWLCVANCEDMADGYNIVMWEKAQKMPVLGLYDAASKGSTETMAFDLLNRFEKKANKVQAAAVLPLEIGDVAIAGFGTFDTKNNMFKSVSGNAAGVIEALTIDTAGCEDCSNYVVELCEDFVDYTVSGTEETDAAASGTWSMKYNKSLSTGKKRASQVIPAYAQE